MKRTLTVFLAISLVFSALSFAVAEEKKQEGPSVVLKVVDLILVRPFSAGVATVSTAFFIATSPLTFVIGVGEPAARVLVEAPWRFTGMRYLGDFENYKDRQPITVVHE